MTAELQSSAATIRNAMGWDFNHDASPEALAAWEVYRDTPGNPNVPPAYGEQDAFTSGADAFRITVPVDYKTAKALPVGTLVELTGSRESNGYWNGYRWVKTSDATWSMVHRTATEEDVARMVAERATGVSPYPANDGRYIIVNAQFVVHMLMEAARVATLNAESRQRSFVIAQDRILDIQSFVMGDDAWQRTPEDDEL